MASAHDMLARAGRYYGTPLKGHRDVTQGYTLFPTIFKMVVGALICHWITLVSGKEAGLDGFGRSIQWLEALFYSNGGPLAFPRTDRLQ